MGELLLELKEEGIAVMKPIRLTKVRWSKFQGEEFSAHQSSHER